MVYQKQKSLSTVYSSKCGAWQEQEDMNMPLKILKATHLRMQTPRPLLTEHAQCENADQVFCK